MLLPAQVMSEDAQKLLQLRALHPELGQKKLLAMVRVEHGIKVKEGKAALAELDAADAAEAAAAVVLVPVPVAAAAAAASPATLLLAALPR